ncbi:MAG: hypothetical protein ACT443_06165 [Gemmatimonadota bacterium]
MSLRALELYQQHTSRRWYLALTLLTLALAAGRGFGNQQDALFFEGVLVGLLVGLNFGFARDRATGFDRYVINFVEPGALFIQKLVVTGSLYVAFFAASWVVSASLWQNAGAATWTVSYTFLVFLLIVPLTLLAEIAFEIRLGAALALAVSAALLAASASIWGIPAVVAFTGLAVTRGSYAGLTRLLALNLAVDPLLVLLAYSLWLRRHRPRSCRRPARRQVGAP